MRKYTTTLYGFKELTPEAQQLVIDASRYFRVEDADWYEYLFDDFEEVCKCLGVEIAEGRHSVRAIRFSGFCSQGDGASFEGQYRYRKGWRKALKAYAPVDEKLESIGEDLQEAQRQSRYNIDARVTVSGRYSNSGCMRVDAELWDEERPVGDETLNQGEESIKEALRRLADWLYSRLNDEHDYLTGDEYIRESLSESDAEYCACGRVFSETEHVVGSTSVA